MPPATLRQQIETQLADAEYTVRELAELFGLRVRDIVDHMEHIRRSQKRRFRLRPPECRTCGFVFKRRHRLNAPSRCPQCRRERIEGPWLSIV